VEWNTDGTITVELYTTSGTLIGDISTTDTTFNSGGVGFQYWTGSDSENDSSAYFDKYEIIG